MDAINTFVTLGIIYLPLWVHIEPLAMSMVASMSVNGYIPMDAAIN